MMSNLKNSKFLESELVAFQNIGRRDISRIFPKYFLTGQFKYKIF